MLRCHRRFCRHLAGILQCHALTISAAIVVITTPAAVVLLAGGTALGTVLPDLKDSTAYKFLADERSTVETERDAALSSYASLKGKYDTLENGMASRESKVTAREAEVGKADAAVKTAEAAVKAREDAVTGAEKAKAARTVGDGTWTVGARTSSRAPTGPRLPWDPPAFSDPLLQEAARIQIP